MSNVGSERRDGRSDSPNSTSASFDRFGSLMPELLSDENMIASDEILRRAADGGLIESSEWQDILGTVVARLELNAKSFKFPKDVPPPLRAPSESIPSSPPRVDPEQHSSDEPAAASQKENDPLSSPPQVPKSTPASSTVNGSAPHRDTASPEDLAAQELSSLPPELLESFCYIQETLLSQFKQYPPHTVQRLAELVLEPQRQYRYLPPYLNALERVISVSSGTNAFPLSPTEPSITGASAVDGGDKPLDDDSLGGALLTPIPWLQNGGRSRRTSSASGKAGPTEDADVPMTTEESLRDTGPVTQGELLRREQELTEPPAPIASGGNRDQISGSQPARTSKSPEPDTGDKPNKAESPEPDTAQPHARGPERVGMEDVGPQDEHATGAGQTLDIEAAVGRGPHQQHSEGAETDQQGHGGRREAAETPEDRAQRDPDGDVELTDVDGKTQEEKDRSMEHGGGEAPVPVETTSK